MTGYSGKRFLYITLFLSFSLLSASTSSTSTKVSISPTSYSWLKNETYRLISGCRLQGINGVTLFTPDASSSYGAQWTRDFTMALSGAPDLIASTGVNVSDSVAFSLSRITSDGFVPDRVQSSGTPIFAPGPPGSWPIKLAWDNSPYAGLMLASLVSSTSFNVNLFENDPSVFFCQYEPAVRRAFDAIPIIQGLAYNDPIHPNVSFGFEDSVVLPGRQLTVSLLVADASKQLASLSSQFHCGNSTFYLNLYTLISSYIDDLFDENSGLFNASDTLETLPDVFGSAYLVTLGLSTPARRSSVATYLAAQFNQGNDGTSIFEEGQVRHLPQPLLWKQCWSGCPSPGTYQNGAFWATPLNWIIPALANEGFMTEAVAIAESAIASFQAIGVMECINKNISYHGVNDYVASATNLFGVVTSSTK
jgi:hypothetical protein